MEEVFPFQCFDQLDSSRPPALHWCQTRLVCIWFWFSTCHAGGGGWQIVHTKDTKIYTLETPPSCCFNGHSHIETVLAMTSSLLFKGDRWLKIVMSTLSQSRHSLRDQWNYAIFVTLHQFIHCSCLHRLLAIHCARWFYSTAQWTGCQPRSACPRWEDRQYRTHWSLGDWSLIVIAAHLVSLENYDFNYSI